MIISSAHTNPFAPPSIPLSIFSTLFSLTANYIDPTDIDNYMVRAIEENMESLEKANTYAESLIYFMNRIGINSSTIMSPQVISGFIYIKNPPMKLLNIIFDLVDKFDIPLRESMVQDELYIDLVHSFVGFLTTLAEEIIKLLNESKG